MVKKGVFIVFAVCSVVLTPTRLKLGMSLGRVSTAEPCPQRIRQRRQRWGHGSRPWYDDPRLEPGIESNPAIELILLGLDL